MNNPEKLNQTLHAPAPVKGLFTSEKKRERNDLVERTILSIDVPSDSLLPSLDSVDSTAPELRDAGY